MQSKGAKIFKTIIKKKYFMEKIIKGYITEACRQVGVTGAVYRTAKKNQRNNAPLTKAQIEVLSKLKELLDDAERKLESLKQK
jgi:hypothetical protein